MSYVETCKTHGQYHGDYCGECVERAFERATGLEAELKRAEDIVAHQGLSIATQAERALELETENLKLSTMEPELARQTERVLQLEKEVTRLKAELWVVNDRALRTYDGATEVPRQVTPAPRPKGSAKPWRCPQFRPGCSPCPDCQRVPAEVARERNTSPHAPDVGTASAQERKTFQQIRENVDAIIKRPPTAEQLADLDATLRATQVCNVCFDTGVVGQKWMDRCPACSTSNGCQPADPAGHYFVQGDDDSWLCKGCGKSAKESLSATEGDKND
jgi:hypothetical protein